MAMQPVQSNKIAINAYAQNYKQLNINKALMEKQFNLLPAQDRNDFLLAVEEEKNSKKDNSKKNKSESNVIYSSELFKNFVRCEKEKAKLKAERNSILAMDKSYEYRVKEVESFAKIDAKEIVEKGDAKIYFSGDSVEQNLPPKYKHMAKFLQGQENDPVKCVSQYKRKHTSFIGSGTELSALRNSTKGSTDFAQFNASFTPEQYMALNNFCFNKRKEYVLDQIEKGNKDMLNPQYNMTFTVAMPDGAQINAWKKANSPKETFKERYQPLAFSGGEEAAYIRLEDAHLTPRNDVEFTATQDKKKDRPAYTTLQVTNQDLEALEKFMLVEQKKPLKK